MSQMGKEKQSVQCIFYEIIKLQCQLDRFISIDTLLPDTLLPQGECNVYKSKNKNYVDKFRKVQVLISKKVFPLIKGITVRYCIKTILIYQLRKLTFISSRKGSLNLREEGIINIFKERTLENVIVFIKGICFCPQNLLSSNIQAAEILKIISIFYDCLYLSIFLMICSDFFASPGREGSSAELGKTKDDRGWTS